MENNDTDQYSYTPYPEYRMEPQEIISVEKFTFLSVITFGLYDLWWMYKSWRFFKQKDNLDILPALRSLFAIFFLYGLCERIFEYGKRKGYTGDYSSLAFASGFIVLRLVSRLPEPYGYVALFSFVFLIVPFKVLNYAMLHDDELTVIEQPSFNSRQIVLLVIGGLLWLLVILGSIFNLYDDRYGV